MKRISVILIMLVQSLLIFSQDSFLSLSMGASIPFGDYASGKNAFSSGYAGTNFVLNFDASYVVVPFVGIGATFSFGSNYADEKSLKNTILTDLIDQYSQINFPDPEITGYSYSITMGKWTYINLMVGPNISIPLSIIHLDFRFLGGLSFLTPPERGVTITWPGDDIFNSQSSQLVNFGYVIGAGIRFGRSGMTGLRIAADYFSSKPAMEIKTEHLLIPKQEKTVKYDLAISTLHVTVGLCFNF
jgi:hypothetical protein